MFKALAGLEERGYLIKMPYPGSVKIEEGEIVKFVRTTSSPGMSPAAQANLTAIGCMIAAESKTASDSAGTVKCYARPYEVFEVPVQEIVGTVTLTATGGSTTTFVDSHLVLGQDDLLIGATAVVLSMASGNQAANTELTVTDYTSSSGTLTFATLGATGFATSDTIKITKLSHNIIGALFLGVYYVDGSTDYEGCRIQLHGHGSADCVTVVGLSDDHTKLQVVLNSHLFAAQAALIAA